MVVISVSFRWAIPSTPTVGDNGGADFPAIGWSGITESRVSVAGRPPSRASHGNPDCWSERAGPVRPRLLGDPAPDSEGGGVSAAASVDFAVQIRHVTFDGVDRETQPESDLRVRLAFGDQREDVDLARG